MALVIDTRNAFGRSLLRGIHDHLAVGSDRWTVWLVDDRPGGISSTELTRWKVDGAIACSGSPAAARAIERSRCPTVDLGGNGLIAGALTIDIDPAAIARLAADHFADLGHDHIACVGHEGRPTNLALREHFAAAMRRRGRPVEFCALASTHRGDAVRRVGGRLRTWLESLPKPVAILACDDATGRSVIAACDAAGLRVPDDVAVLGVHDDDLVVPGQPSLSSIATDARAAGRLAAETLARLLAGRTVAAARLMPPLGLVVRESTDAVAARDPVVAAAARFIRAHAHRGIRVVDVVAATQLGRRSLTQRFLRAVGRTPHDEIRRAQLQRVESLLRDTDLTLAAVAGRCGFKHPEYMTAVFTRHHGVPPREFRRAVRTALSRPAGWHAPPRRTQT